MKPPVTFGAYVKHLRRSQGKLLREAAEALEITPGYLSKIENGDAQPPRGTVISRMAEYYGVQKQDLIARMPESRAIDVATSDDTLGPFVRACYRLGIGSSKQEQMEMLKAAIEQLDLSPEKQEWLRKELRKILGDVDGSDDKTGLYRIPGRYNDLYDTEAVPRRLRSESIETIATQVLMRFYGGNMSEFSPPTPVESIIESYPDIDLEVFGDEVGGRMIDGSPSVLGRCRWNGPETRLVGVHESLFDECGTSARRRGRFTLGHELFHAIEHLPRMSHRARCLSLNRMNALLTLNDITRTWHGRKRKTPQTAEDWREYQANTFSAALLMPAFSVRTLFGILHGPGAGIVEPGSRTADVRAAAEDLARRPAIEREGRSQSLCDIFDVNPQPMAIRLVGLGLVRSE